MRTKMTAEDRIAYRWIPENSTEHKNEFGVAYAYTTGNGKFCVVAYSGSAQKAAFHELYNKEASRDDRITDFLKGLETSAALKAKTREERSKPHTIKVGDILHHSWGWEQTNCDYYQVLAVTAHGATIQPIQSETVEGSEYSHGMADMRTPVANSFCGTPIKVRVDGYNSVTSFAHGSGRVWDGKPNYCSWYA